MSRILAKRQKLNMHERFDREANLKHSSSDRSFGLVMVAFFLFLGIVSVFRGGIIRWWAFAIATVFLVTALLKPNALNPLNRIWTRFGLLLQKITNPIIMGILFYFVISPFAAIIRAFGKDPINRKFDSEVESYWTARQFDDSAQGMKNQF